MCRLACAWIRFVWCDENRLSPRGSLLRRTSNGKHCQQQCICTCVPAFVCVHACMCACVYLCVCTLKPSKCSRLRRDPSTWLKSNTTLLLLLSFCLTLFHTKSHFHLIPSTASSVSHSILESVTFHLFCVILLYTNTHTHTMKTNTYITPTTTAVLHCCTLPKVSLSCWLQLLISSIRKLFRFLPAVKKKKRIIMYMQRKKL